MLHEEEFKQSGMRNPIKSRRGGGRGGMRSSDLLKGRSGEEDVC